MNFLNSRVGKIEKYFGLNEESQLVILVQGIDQLPSKTQLEKMNADKSKHYFIVEFVTPTLDENGVPIAEGRNRKL